MEHSFDFTNAVGIPYFNFIVFVALFLVFFRKTLSSMAASRRTNFLAASKEASAALETARIGFDDVKKRFDSLEAELKSFKQQSETAALQESKKLMEDTVRFINQLKDETNRLAGEAVLQARQQLRQDIVLQAKAEVAAKLQQDLDGQAKEKILKSRITEAASLMIQ
jgi:F0F1-type ATP synthase membrane subunit b/b'